MPLKIKHLLAPFSCAMHEGDAAFFIGSGLSQPAGLVDWQGLLANCALEIDLNVEREHDLVAVAQYYLNRRSKDRSALNQTIVDNFYKPGAYTMNHRILAQMPVSTIWTTNYDELIEEALRRERKRVDVKKRDRDIVRRTAGRQVVLYKMHGDVADPEEVIICKDDYERYARTHPVFQNTLEGDLLTKTFLFLGFSFNDPNLDHMLSHVRSLLNDSKRTHYSIMRKVRLSWDKSWDEAEFEFEYAKVKQGLEIENLERYSVHTLLVDNYKDITCVLRALEQEYTQRIIYVCVGESEEEVPAKLSELARQLGIGLLDQEYKVSCDFGTTLGRKLFAGAMQKIDEKLMYPIERYLLRPLPRKFDNGQSPIDFATASRFEMIKKSGFVIYLGGSGPDQPNIIKDLESETELEVAAAGSGNEAWIAWRRLKPETHSVSGSAQVSEHFRHRVLTHSEPKGLVAELLDVIRDVSSGQPELWKRSIMTERDRRQLYEKFKLEYAHLPDKTLRRIVGDL